jgi:hypothetical protein
MDREPALTLQEFGHFRGVTALGGEAIAVDPDLEIWPSHGDHCFLEAVGNPDPGVRRTQSSVGQQETDARFLR